MVEPEEADADSRVPTPDAEASSAENGDSASADTVDGSLPSDAGSPCEALCGQVYTCLQTTDADSADAASIELGCLDACVQTANAEPTGAFVGCPPPTASNTDTCPPFLTCVREAWPELGEVQTPEIELVRDGCEAACNRYADCESAGQEAAEACGELCRGALPPDLQVEIGRCARFRSCGEVIDCIESFPGA